MLGVVPMGLGFDADLRERVGRGVPGGGDVLERWVM